MVKYKLTINQIKIIKLDINTQYLILQYGVYYRLSNVIYKYFFPSL